MTYQIGQIEACDLETSARRPITVTGPLAGPPRWHALTVRPQREAAAEAWLELRGCYAFHPVTRTRVVRHGKVIERERRYLPGYVFCRFPSQVIISRVLACPVIAGAITLQSGQWGIITPEDIRKLHAMRSVDDAQRAARDDAKRIRKGDRVRVLAGVLGEGMEVEVVDIVAGKARFTLHMFGTDVRAEADIDHLHKLE